jgi:hypothetical protein
MLIRYWLRDVDRHINPRCITNVIRRAHRHIEAIQSEKSRIIVAQVGFA